MLRIEELIYKSIVKFIDDFTNEIFKLRDSNLAYNYREVRKVIKGFAYNMVVDIVGHVIFERTLLLLCELYAIYINIKFWYSKIIKKWWIKNLNYKMLTVIDST